MVHRIKFAVFEENELGVKKVLGNIDSFQLRLYSYRQLSNLFFWMNNRLDIGTWTKSVSVCVLQSMLLFYHAF